jgi:hypothetical protein
MVGEYGAVGYGLYWRIVEMLHNEESHKLPLKTYLYTAISKQMSTSVEQVQTFVQQCITDYELMLSDDSHFWIERVFKNIEKREELSEKRSLAGKISAERRKKSTSVEQKSTNDNKGKEIKGKESINNTPNGVSSSEESENPSERIKINYDELLKYWNDKTKLPKITKLTKKRKESALSRAKEHGKKSLQTVIDKTSISGFLNGENDRNWAADFDWVFRPTNFLKILEGNYDRKNGSPAKKLTVEEVWGNE